MRNLLYTTAFGREENFPLAAEMILSARRAGFRGEIAVLADRPWDFPEGARTYVLHGMTDRDLWRASLCRALNPWEYGKILCADAGIVFARNPEELLGFGGIAVADSRAGLHESGVARRFLTEEEIHRCRRDRVHGIDSAVLAFDGSEAYRFLDRWQERWRSLHKSSAPDPWEENVRCQDWDEAALQTLCLRGEIEWEPIPRGLARAVADRADHPDRVTIVVTCMGRLAFLQRTLPNWLANTPFRVVVVDYSCPDGTAEWIGGAAFGLRVSVVRCAAEVRGGRPIFNVSRARNAGAAAVDGGYLLFLDAETELDPGFAPWLVPQLDPARMFPVAAGGKRSLDLCGTLCVHAAAFRAAGGFDEAIEGWGSEDHDMKLRLHLRGLAARAVPLELLSAHAHSDALRTVHHEERNLSAVSRAHWSYLDSKYLRLTGRPFSKWFRDPALRGVILARPNHD